MKQLRPAKKPNPHAKKIVVQFRVDAEEMREILKNSHAFTKGNISAFARFATLNFKPTRKDFSK